ncbi:hypothetical protein JZ751_018615 [Albula glossodonta]|uniref:Protein SMG9 n=1 Tax=Albula glossodonta TaxID=121402 RepID=A0A8T2MTD7_9TELE|nr:hypothetical protein JZ751_018615 [Albula glossodonta]
MSESGHSQPGMYGQGRRRRRRREREAGPPGQNLSGPGRDREYVPRERRSKPSQTAPAPVSLEKPIMLIKTREEGGKPGTPPDSAPPAPGPGTAKLEREGQRPTQPVYQIQNRGMGSAASTGSVDPVIGQTKLLPPEKMKHSIKLVDDQMNWSYVFRAQSQEIKERGGNQSSGIDFYITQERVIFLDTQPILSPSILDHLINNDRKLPPEYNLPHTYVEMQSLQIAAFLFTVCHVVITEVNLFLLPLLESDGEDAISRAGSGSAPLFSLLPGYRGHPSFSSLVSKLRSQVLAMSRCQLSHTILTEKNWFHYAARIWDGVKKSSALSEYSRLLS